MKKILLFLIIILGMCGCSSNKFSNFEHYTLKDKDLMTYTYVDSDYAIADISTDGSEMSNYGIFYKINSNDYILIDKIESTQKKENIANFYDDKEDIWRGGIPKNCSVCIVEVKDGVGTVLEKDKIFYDEAE